MRTILLLLFFCQLCRGATTVDNTFLSWSNNIVNASDGDTCVLTNGTFLWESAITLNSKALHLMGDPLTGRTNCILISTNIDSCLIWRTSSSGGLPTVSDMNLVGDAANGNGFLQFGGAAESAPYTGTNHVYNITMTNIALIGISMGYSDSYGLIDHCKFAETGAGGGWNAIAFGGNEYLSWSNSSPIGTMKQVVVEDCTFDNNSGNTGNGHFDAYNGASCTIRHCVFNGAAASGNHGYDSQVTSTRVMEIYNNVFTNNNGITALIECRGGVCYFGSNSVYGTAGVVASTLNPDFTLYRGCFGAYQGTYGYSGIRFTNQFSGTAASGTGTTLVDNGNNTSLYLNEHNGRSLHLVSGTGAGQTLTIASMTATTFTVSGGTFSPAPDNTTGYQIEFVDGNTILVGSSPAYTFKTTVTGGNNVNRYVLLGSDLAHSLTNLYAAVNSDPSQATILYAGATTNNAIGRNTDLQAVAQSTVSLMLTNILDGTGQFGYPAAFQQGVLSVTKFTNSPIVQTPCYSWSNTFNGTGLVNFQLTFGASSCGGMNNSSNLLVNGRDYSNNAVAPYTPLVYPHPLVALETSAVIASRTGPGRPRKR